MALPATAATQTVPDDWLAIKNNTASSITCRLEQSNGNAIQLTFKPGEEHFRYYDSPTTFSISCPAILNGKPIKPLQTGARYNFLSVNGELRLVEVTADG